MRDPFSWSFPIGYLAGVTVRVHYLLPLFMIGSVLRYAHKDYYLPGTWQDAAWLMGLMFVAVLLHEFGHVLAARRVDGEANEIVLWPLGGLARCDVPHTPYANFVTALGGPAVNIALCVVSGLVLAFAFSPGYQPPWNPIYAPFRILPSGEIDLVTWAGTAAPSAQLPVKLVAMFFWINWVLTLLNLVLVGFPFDAGRMLQSAFWPSVGYRQATLYAIFSGFFVLMPILIIVSLVVNETLWLLLAWFTYTACKQEWFTLETGGEDNVFGYDFSQGYTSLEKEEPTAPAPRRRKQNFLQRWLQRRAQRKMQEAQEQQLADERRMDELLDKIQRYGKESLTDEEQRFLKRVSDRYKNRPY